jgi:hypothetical protein
MNMNRMLLRGIVVGFFLSLTGSLAFGQNNRSWVSGAGTNNGICDRANPCDTFANALLVTNPGGEIDVLDPGEFGTVTINKSVSIVADGVLGGIFASGSGVDGIFVDAAATDVVVLRGLTINGDGSSSSSGIQLKRAGELHIEGCTINHFGFAGIFVAPMFTSPKVFIKDTIVRNNRNADGLTFFPGATASLDNVRTENNSFGLHALSNTNVSVRNSVAAGNATGFEANGAVLNLESSIASGNGTGIGCNASSATINMSNVTVVNNGTGLLTLNGGQIVSFGNNKITDNGTNGSPTKTISQK